MNCLVCDVSSFAPSAEFLPKLVATHDAVVRLDERLQQSAVGAGWVERSLFAEACACQLTEGDLVDLEDLVLFDALSFAGETSIPLASAWQIIRAWRHATRTDAATLLRADRPGMADDEVARPGSLAQDDSEDRLDLVPPIDTERREAWRRVLSETRSATPLVAAALVWDAWLTLAPEPSAAWRAPLLAALVLKQRGVTSSWLVPIDTGRRHASYRRHPAHSIGTRIAGFLSWVDTAAARGQTSLMALGRAAEVMRTAMRISRSTSRLPALADLLIRRPLVSAPMAAAALGITPQAVLRMLPRLGSTVREMSGRTRFRVWSVTAR